MADDIELAHRLSLVQRNLDMAQTALDSAVEFFSQAMTEIQTLFNAGRGVIFAP